MVDLKALFSLTGKRVLVTGSSRGIGRALASGLAAAGARVALHGATASQALDGAVAEVGNGAIAIAGDLATIQAVDAIAEQALSALGGVDILVLNASIEVREAWDAISHDAFARQVAVNLEASTRLISALAPGMVDRRWGRILGIGSIQEVKESPAMPVYAGLKAAQTSLMRNLARQFAASGITCNTLAPGVVETDRNRQALTDAALRERLTRQIPMAHFGEADDFIGAAVFLCSDAGRYVTGVRLLVDGGMHL
ncbi:SDR family oxidoreductase [Corticibacterium sp. UT-5YL-CI-8]|nr:SDR family oxidoreductase [Tianweitania sp. UT-5YL-CI-8]